MKMRPFARLCAGAAVLGVVTTASLAAACGGGGGAAFDPKKADDLAHLALITSDELPGSGWTVTSQDKFEDDDTKLADSADTVACRAVDAKKTDEVKASQKERAGRANIDFEAEPGPADMFPTSVQETVAIYNSSGATEKAANLFKEIVSSREFSTCMGDVMKASVAQGAGSGIDVKTTSAKTSRTVPENGASTAFQVEISAQGETLSIKFEFYLWRYENAGITLSLAGETANMNAKLAGPIIDAANSALKATGKKK